jgi:hypothetical protein
MSTLHPNYPQHREQGKLFSKETNPSLYEYIRGVLKNKNWHLYGMPVVNDPAAIGFSQKNSSIIRREV